MTHKTFFNYSHKQLMKLSKSIQFFFLLKKLHPQIINVPILIDYIRTKSNQFMTYKKRIKPYNQQLFLISNNMIEQNHTCSICLTVFLNPVKLPNCQHIFCESCISDTSEVTGNNKCPLCRKNFNPSNLIKQTELRQLVEARYPQILADRRKNTVQTVKYELLIGNTTQILNTQDQNKYNWTFYIKQKPGQKPIWDMAEKVQVNLHPTFRPPTITYKKGQSINCPRRGWGTFEINSTIFWKKQCGGGTSDVSHYLNFVPKDEKIVVCRLRYVNNE